MFECRLSSSLKNLTWKIKMHVQAIRHLAATIFTIPLLFAPVFAEDTHQARQHRHLSATATELITRLQSGGYVLVVRHERTNAFIPDSSDVELGNCATQRNLSVAGYANAVENGAVLRHLEIPIGQVFASPACRTLETGRLLFGSVHAEARLLGYGQESEIVRAAFTQLVQEGAGHSQNTALVTHLGTYSVAFGGHLAEGDTAIFDVVDGAPVLLGTIAANAWNDAIIDASLVASEGEGHTHGNGHD